MPLGDRFRDALGRARPVPPRVRWSIVGAVVSLGATFGPWLTGVTGTRSFHLSSYDLWLVGLGALLCTAVVLVSVGLAAVFRRPVLWLVVSGGAGIATGLGAVGVWIGESLSKLNTLDLTSFVNEHLGLFSEYIPTDQATLRVDTGAGLWVFLLASSTTAILASFNAASDAQASRGSTPGAPPGDTAVRPMRWP